MPMYTVSTKQPLPPQTREALAQNITRIHCEITGAPATFVNVVFWTNVPLPQGQMLNLFGTVRGGRSDQKKRRLRQALLESVAANTAVDLGDIGYSAFDISAKCVMEGGVVLPEPGEEERWLAAHPDV